MHFPTLTLTITLALTLSVSALRPSPTPVSNRDRHRDLSKRVHSPADGLTQFNAFHAVSGRDVSAREVGEGREGGWEKRGEVEEGEGEGMWMKRETKEEREMTNGERMKRGLPPKKPLFRRQAQGAAAPRPRPSALPPSSRTANTGSGGSGTCTPRTGVIRISGGGFNGYLSRRANPFGEYLVQTERGNALSVVLVDECNTAPGGSENLRAVNGFATFPLLGGIQGFSSENPDLRPHTRNYLYVGGVAQSAVGARPAVVGNSFSATTGDSEPSESAIWVVGSDGQVTVRWVNADGSTPANSVVYVGGRNVLAVVGDVEAFVGSVEAASPVTLTFVV